MTDVFISYSRKDRPFVRRLFNELEVRQRNAWVDWHSIPYSVEWWAEIERGIDNANTFLFIISPDSLASDNCHAELTYARRHNKRIVPVVRRPIDEAQTILGWYEKPWEDDARENWKTLKSLNWLYMRKQPSDDCLCSDVDLQQHDRDPQYIPAGDTPACDFDDFLPAFENLLETLDTDIDYVREHTRLLARAREWDARGRRDSAVLRGDDLTAAELWLAGAAGKSPEPTDLHRDYISASRTAAARRQRVVVGGLTFGMVVALTLAALSFVLYRNAESERLRADDNAATSIANAASATVAQGQAELNAATATIAQGQAEIQSTAAIAAAATADRNAEEARSLALIASADRALGADNTDLALGLILEALALPRPPVEAQALLPDVLAAPGTRRLFTLPQEAAGGLPRLMNQLISGNFAAQIGLRGNVPPAVATIQAETDESITWMNELLEVGSMNSLLRRIAFGGADGALDPAADRVYGMGAGGLFAWEAGSGRPLWQYVPTPSLDSTDLRTFDLTALALSPDRRTLLVAERRVSFGLADNNFNFQAGGTALVRAVLYGNDPYDLWLELESSASWLVLLDAATGAEIARYDVPDTEAVLDVAYTPDGSRVVLALMNRRLVLFDPQTGTFEGHFQRVRGHRQAVRVVDVSPDGRLAASGDLGGVVIVWDMATGDIVHHIEVDGVRTINALAFSPAGDAIAVGANNAQISLWNTADATQRWIHQDTAGRKSEGTLPAITTVAFNPVNNVIVTGSVDGYMAIRRAEDGTPLRRLVGHDDSVRAAVYSDDGSRLLSASNDGTLRLWDINGGDLTQRRSLGQLDDSGFYSADFNNDGTLAVTATDDYVYLWDIASGSLLRRFASLSQPAPVRFHPDGRGIVVASQNHGTLIRYALDGTLLDRFKETSGSVTSIDYSADGSRLLLNENDLLDMENVTAFETGLGDYLALRDPRSYALRVRIDYPDDMFNDIFWEAIFSPDGRHILSGSLSGMVHLWDADTGALIQAFPPIHRDAIDALAFSPDGRLALSGSSDDTVVLWDTTTGGLITRFEEHTDDIASVAFSPDGQSAITGSIDGVVLIWDVVDQVGRVERRIEGRDLERFVLSPDGRLLLTLSGTGEAQLWNTAQTLDELLSWLYSNRYVAPFTCEERAIYSLQPCVDLTPPAPTPNLRLVTTTPTPTATPTLDPAAFSPTPPPTETLPPSPLLIVYDVRWNTDGTRIATSAADGSVRVWDADTGALLLTLGGHTNDLVGADWSPDGTRLVSNDVDNSAVVWDAQTGERLLTLSHEAIVNYVLFSPDGTRIVTSSEDTTAAIWDAQTGERLLTLSGHSAPLNSVIWSPDGTRVGTTSDDWTARIWDAGTGEPLLTLAEHDNEVLRIGWSPDGRRIATTAWDGYTRVWDGESGALLHTLEVNGGPDSAVQLYFLPDSTRLVTSGFSGVVRVWRVNDGTEVVSLPPSRGLTRVRPSPDGRRALIAGVDGQGSIVDLETGETLQRFESAFSWFSGGWSPDGRRIALGDSDGYTQVWDADSGTPLLMLPAPAEVAAIPTVGARFNYTPTPTPSPTPAPSTTPTGTPEARGSLRPGETEGVILIGRADTWTYRGRAGETLSLRVRAEWDSVVSIYAPDGTLLAENDDADDGLFESALPDLTLPADGEYRIEVRAWDNRTEGSYTLILRQSAAA